MLTLALLSLAHAETWIVDPSGEGDADTIADGVALLADGDTLSIAAGTYDVVDVILGVSDIVIEGSGWDSTVFDGSAVHQSNLIGLRITGENVTISGLSARNYMDSTGMEVDGSATFKGCAFVNNKTGARAAYYSTSRLSFFDTTFANNSYALFVPNSLDTLHIENALFIDNYYGVWLTDYENASAFNQIEIVNNTFVGGGVAIQIIGTGLAVEPGDTELSIVNNLFSGMQYRWWLGFGGYVAMTAEIRNNVYSSLTVEMEDEDRSTYTMAENVEADPQFVAWSDDSDWTDDDLHLIAGSPGIDAGVDGYATLTSDADGMLRPVDGDGDDLAQPDAGAYEYCPTDTCPEGDTDLPDDTGTTTDTGIAPDTGDSSDTGSGSDTDPPADTDDHVIHTLGCATAGDTGRSAGVALVLAAMMALRRRKT